MRLLTPQRNKATSEATALEEIVIEPSVSVDIANPAMEFRDLSVGYGKKPAIREVSLKIPRQQITAIIGPSGCGKSTYLRAINRMNDAIRNCRTTGQLLVDGEDVHGANVDPVLLRRKVGLIFEKPNPFPKSVYDNVAFGVRLHYRASKQELDRIV